MTLAPTTTSLEVGKTADVVVTIAPLDATDKTVTAKSADESKVTAAVTGTTVTLTGVAATDTPVSVTVTVGGKTATVAVTVIAPTEG
ncbi:Ig-like domain-containing protein [Lacticaseibacillus absianus]|uniref:Ig-like domain-containing protein n=1 Tax=Lacticaseibacillus absianus TaxID=2729623 RepID=UPI0015CE8703